MFFIIEEAKETTLEFRKELWQYCNFSIKYQYKMTQYKALNVKLSNSQLNKLKSRIKNGTEITLKILSNVIGDSNDENNLPHRLLLTNTQVSRLREAFENNSSATVL